MVLYSRRRPGSATSLPKSDSGDKKDRNVQLSKRLGRIINIYFEMKMGNQRWIKHSFNAFSGPNKPIRTETEFKHLYLS